MATCPTRLAVCCSFQSTIRHLLVDSQMPLSMFGGGRNSHVVLSERVDNLENVLMTNLPRLPTMENKIESIRSQMRAMETRLDREIQRRRMPLEGANATEIVPASSDTCGPGQSLTASMAEGAPKYLDDQDPQYRWCSLSSPLIKLQRTTTA